MVALDGTKVRAGVRPNNIAGAERPPRRIAYTALDIDDSLVIEWQCDAEGLSGSERAEAQRRWPE